MAAMEGGVAALAVASGMAAISYAILTIARSGDNIVSMPQLYGGTYTLFTHVLPDQGIEVRFAEDDSPLYRHRTYRRYFGRHRTGFKRIA